LGFRFLVVERYQSQAATAETFIIQRRKPKAKGPFYPFSTFHVPLKPSFAGFDVFCTF